MPIRSVLAPVMALSALMATCQPQSDAPTVDAPQMSTAIAPADDVVVPAVVDVTTDAPVADAPATRGTVDTPTVDPVVEFAEVNGWPIERARLAIDRFAGGHTFRLHDCSTIRVYYFATGAERGRELGEMDALWGWASMIADRESGCCPNAIGGDILDANCGVTGISTRTHRSDSGVWQINGVHWRDGIVCSELGLCDQASLLDPWNNAAAFWLLYETAGKSPWKRR